MLQRKAAFFVCLLLGKPFLLVLRHKRCSINNGHSPNTNFHAAWYIYKHQQKMSSGLMNLMNRLKSITHGKVYFYLNVFNKNENTYFIFKLQLLLFANL
jgi:hypothetical protein